MISLRSDSISEVANIDQGVELTCLCESSRSGGQFTLSFEQQASPKLRMSKIRIDRNGLVEVGQGCIEVVLPKKQKCPTVVDVCATRIEPKRFVAVTHCSFEIAGNSPIETVAIPNIGVRGTFFDYL